MRAEKFKWWRRVERVLMAITIFSAIMAALTFIYRKPAVASPSDQYEYPMYSTKIERIQVGNCWYILANGRTGVALCHAGDCDNPAHQTKASR